MISNKVKADIKLRKIASVPELWNYVFKGYRNYIVSRKGSKANRLLYITYADCLTKLEVTDENTWIISAWCLRNSRLGKILFDGELYVDLNGERIEEMTQDEIDHALYLVTQAEDGRYASIEISMSDADDALGTSEELILELCNPDVNPASLTDMAYELRDFLREIQGAGYK
jgi:hypothetical protein